MSTYPPPYLHDLHCICCGLETNIEDPDKYTCWSYFFWFGKSVTRRRSDASFYQTLSYLCCLPLCSSTHYFESHGNGYTREQLSCCCPPCCLDVTETATSCQCEVTTLCSNTRTCYYQEFGPNGERSSLVSHEESLPSEGSMN